MLPGFPQIDIGEFLGLHTLGDFRNVRQPFSPGPCKNIEFIAGPHPETGEITTVGWRSRRGTSTAFDLGGGADVQHIEVFLKADSGGRFFIMLIDGQIFSSSGGGRTLLTTPPVGTTHLRVVAYGNRAYLLFSEGTGGLAEPKIWDGTNLDPFTVAGQSVGAMAAVEGAAGKVGGGVHKLWVIYETRAGFRINSRSGGPDNDGKISFTAKNYKATATLTVTANFADGETITIGSVVYTWKTTLSSPVKENEILIGTLAADSLDNLTDAIDAFSPNVGTTYSEGTVAHPTVTATTNTDTTQVVEARTAGTAGNSIAVSETAANASWGGATLAGGGPRKIELSSIPLHADPSVVKRHIAMTEADLEAGHIALTINDNTTTTGTVDITDAQLKLQTPVDNYNQHKQPGPSGMTGFLFHERLILIDGTSRVWVSEPGLPHTFRSDVGFIDVNVDDGQRMTNGFVIREHSPYLVKAQKLFVTQDTGEDPSDWPVSEVSKSLGTASIYGLETQSAEQWAALVDFKALYVFGGGAPVDLSLPIKADWDAQNYLHMHKAKVTIDEINREIICFIPSGASTTPNKVLVADYKATPQGQMPTRQTIRWSERETQGVTWRGFLTDYKNTTEVRMLVYGQSPLVRKFDANAVDDNGAAMAWKHRLGYIEPPSRNGASRTGLGLFAGVEGKMTGAGSLNLELFGPDAVSLLLPTPITLAAAPEKDMRRLFAPGRGGVRKERIYLEMGQTSLTAPFILNRLSIYAKALGMRMH